MARTDEVDSMIVHQTYGIILSQITSEKRRRVEKIDIFKGLIDMSDVRNIF